MCGPPLAVSVGKVSPRSPGTQNPEEAVDDLLVILVRSPAPLNPRQQVLVLFELLVGKFEASASHPEAGNSMNQNLMPPTDLFSNSV
jgi:hypothetical protein